MKQRRISRHERDSPRLPDANAAQPFLIFDFVNQISSVKSVSVSLSTSKAHSMPTEPAAASGKRAGRGFSCAGRIMSGGVGPIHREGFRVGKTIHREGFRVGKTDGDCQGGAKSHPDSLHPVLPTTSPLKWSVFRPDAPSCKKGGPVPHRGLHAVSNGHVSEQLEYVAENKEKMEAML